MNIWIFEDWAQLLEVVGIWLAAIATFAAAVVALHLGNRSTRLQLQLSAGPMKSVFPGSGLPPKDIFLISATNVGMRPALVTHVGMKNRFPRRQAVLLQFSNHSARLPANIGDGEQAQFFLDEVCDWGNWYSQFNDWFPKTNLGFWMSSWFFRFFIVCSTGKTISVRPNPAFFERVRHGQKGNWEAA